jgi:hypothetical protein
MPVPSILPAFCLIGALYVMSPAQAQIGELPTWGCSIRYDHDIAGNRTSRYWYCWGHRPKAAEQDSTLRALEDLTLQVFPNPASDRLTVSLSAPIEGGRYEVHDVQGRMLSNGPFNGERMQLPLGELPAGLYTLRVIRQEELLMRSFMVE